MYDIETTLLRNSRDYKFDTWEQDKVSIPEKAGVYLIWYESKLIYVGMAGVKNGGLRRRLRKHASGNRGGNLFCVKICDTYIVPYLNDSQREQLKNGIDIFDGKHGLIREFVRNNLKYQFIETTTKQIAYKIEEYIRMGKSELESPYINPKS
jgi:hypothetical protein